MLEFPNSLHDYKQCGRGQTKDGNSDHSLHSTQHPCTLIQRDIPVAHRGKGNHGEVNSVTQI